ncbi:MAG TPA: 16S rRNA (cytosine(1402)-N(4))-methyltransferase RsmH [Bacteroidales bacterium]|nr:16S rRNA (cytosine(1402)-N(4))-methyltransferase RsmH [Bacteroidales bacterium]
MYHQPALLHECIEGLGINPSGVYADLTFGGGGHSREILAKLNADGRLLAFDQDEDAISNAIDDARFTLVNENFRYLKNFLRLHKAFPVDGILADLGISSHQIDTPERGFATRFEGPLDMRMARNQGITASDMVNTYPEEKLLSVFKLYGEISNARQLAAKIVEARIKPITTTGELKEAIKSCMPPNYENKYLAQVFQAIRIEINDEMGALQAMLKQCADALKPGGRLVVISYHSLEDRLVKNYIKAGNLEGELQKDFYGNVLTPFKSITRKPITPSEEELASNPRSRSAKLRIAQKI